MKYIKTFENYDEGDEELDAEIYDIARNLGKFIRNDAEALETATYYYQTLEKLEDDGGEVYRLIFLKNENDLNKDELGESWTIDKTSFDDFASNLHRNYVLESENDIEKNERMNMKPYLVTATIGLGNIDWEKSVDIFSYMYYYEYEVILNSNPDTITIEEYERTWDDVDIEN